MERYEDVLEYYFRATPSFEIEGDKYVWLNRSVFIATCERYSATVVLHVYQIV
jgi:hypothetical protein